MIVLHGGDEFTQGCEQVDLAISSLTYGLKLDPKNSRAYFQLGKTKKAIEVIRRAAKEVNYPAERHTYLRKQLLRFREGEPNIRPPALS